MNKLAKKSLVGILSNTRGLIARLAGTPKLVEQWLYDFAIALSDLC